MEQSHNTHIITNSSANDHSYKFDKDGNILVENLEDLIYDKGINGEYSDIKKNKEKFHLNFKIKDDKSNNRYNKSNSNKKIINLKQKNNENNNINSEENDDDLNNKNKNEDNKDIKNDDNVIKEEEKKEDENEIKNEEEKKDEEIKEEEK